MQKKGILICADQAEPGPPRSSFSDWSGDDPVRDLLAHYNRGVGTGGPSPVPVWIGSSLVVSSPPGPQACGGGSHGNSGSHFCSVKDRKDN